MAASHFADLYFMNASCRESAEGKGEDYESYLSHTPLLSWAAEQVSHSLAANFFHSAMERFGGTCNDLLSLIIRFRESRCKDPKDHIFALLGIASDHKCAKIVADYSRPLQKVYQDVIRYVADIEDLVLFSQYFQELLRAPLEMDRELEKEVISKGVDIGKRRPWVELSSWGGEVVSIFGPTLDKRRLIPTAKLPTLIRANLEDIAPVTGLPKAILSNDKRYQRAVVEARGE